MENSAKAFSRRFFQGEDGAVTVDWVVLTAAIVGIGTAVSASVASGTLNLSGDVAANLEDTELSGAAGGATVGFGGAWAEYLSANGDDAVAARAAVEADAPDGYYFSGWIDGASGQPLYTADGGASFLVGDNSYGFSQYWSSVANGSYPL